MYRVAAENVVGQPIRGRPEAKLWASDERLDPVTPRLEVPLIDKRTTLSLLQLLRDPQNQLAIERVVAEENVVGCLTAHRWLAVREIRLKPNTASVLL